MGKSQPLRQMTEAEQKLVTDNINLVYSEWMKLHRSPLVERWKEDMCAEATFRLCRAAQAFDPSRGYAFSTFACTAIRNSFLHSIRILQKKVIKDTSGDSPAFRSQSQEEDSDSVFDMMDGGFDWDRLNDKLNLPAAMATLSDLQRTIMTLWAQGWELKTIADKLGKTHSTITSNLGKAKQRLRKFYQEGSVRDQGRPKGKIVGNGNYYIGTNGKYKPINRLENWKNIKKK